MSGHKENFIEVFDALCHRIYGCAVESVLSDELYEAKLSLYRLMEWKPVDPSLLIGKKFDIVGVDSEDSYITFTAYSGLSFTIAGGHGCDHVAYITGIVGDLSALENTPILRVEERRHLSFSEDEKKGRMGRVAYTFETLRGRVVIEWAYPLKGCECTEPVALRLGS